MGCCTTVAPSDSIHQRCPSKARLTLTVLPSAPVSTAGSQPYLQQRGAGVTETRQYQRRPNRGRVQWQHRAVRETHYRGGGTYGIRHPPQDFPCCGGGRGGRRAEGGGWRAEWRREGRTGQTRGQREVGWDRVLPRDKGGLRWGRGGAGKQRHHGLPLVALTRYPWAAGPALAGRNASGR